MVVISCYSIRREKTSLSRENIIHLVYGFFLGAWTIFCVCELPELQAEQRHKVMEQEKQIRIEQQVSEATVSKVEPKTVQQKTVVIPKQENKTYGCPPSRDPISKTDLELLARLIEAECGIESYQCKLYAGSVVLNRVASDKFPNTIYDVIFQQNKGTYQFSVAATKEDGTKAIDCEPSKDSLKAAKKLLLNGSQLPEDVMVFYSANCTGNWVNTRKTYNQVDHTVFAYIYSE